VSFEAPADAPVTGLESIKRASAGSSTPQTASHLSLLSNFGQIWRGRPATNVPNLSVLRSRPTVVGLRHSAHTTLRCECG
jgi:hypothetical protein